MNWKALRAAWLCAIMVTIALVGRAQTTAGSVYGAVTDPSGAAIPNAKVVIRDVHTGVIQANATNGKGEYLFSTVKPSDYTVTASAPGFKSITETGVTVAANVNVHVPVAMQIGATDETVDVQAGVTLVDTRETQIGDTIDQDKLENLPTLNRAPYNLLQTVTGVESYSPDSPIGGSLGTMFSVNGFPGNAGSFYLDGAYNNAFLNNGGNKTPDPDALSQFRVITSNYDAEFGRDPGGVVNVITRSGTDHYHGNLYEYLQNDMFNSKNYFAANVPLLRQHQFGGSLGGPVPRFRQMFFFINYEHYLFHSVNVTGSNLQTATALERAGDFSQSKVRPNFNILEPASASNPMGTGVCPGASKTYMVCAAALDPVAQKLLSFVPVYNAATGLSAQQTAPQNGVDDQGTIRLDYSGIRNHQISGTFFNAVGDVVFPFAGGNQIIGIPGVLPAYSNFSAYENQMNAILADNWTVSERTVNQVRGFYSQIRSILANQIPGRLLGDLGSTAPEGGPILGPPQFVIGGYWTEGPIAGPSDINELSFGLIDTAILSRGHHSIKLGGSWNSSKYSQDNTGNAGQGVFSFSGAATGNALSDFILGKAAAFAESSDVHHRSRNQDPALYAQDDWQITRTLNLNLGVRWELFAPFTGDTTEATFKAGAQSTIIPNAPLGLQYVGDQGVPDGIFFTSYKRFAPRVGVAWDVYGNGRTGLRAGYGIFYTSWTQADLNNFVQAPLAFQITTNSTPNLVCPYGGSTPPCPAGTPALTSPIPFPFVFNPNSRAFASNAAVYSAPAHSASTPYSNEYNLSLEQQLSKSSVLRISYVGSTEMRQRLALDINEPTYYPNAPVTTASINCRRPYQPYRATVNTTPTGPTCTFNAFDGINSFQFSQINQTSPEVNGNYNSLQVELRGKLGKQLDFSSSYVWSKALNYFAASVNPLDIRMNYGAAAVDQRNRFVFSGVYREPQVHVLGLFGREALGGWNLSNVTILHSGSPFTVVSGVDTNRDGVNNDRVNIIGDPYTHASTRAAKIKQYLNPAAFTVPCFNSAACNPYGNEQPNSLYGPMYVDTDLALFKDFALYRNLRFQFRAEAYNAINNVNLGAPRSNLQVLPTAPTQILTANTPRQFQFAGKLEF